MRNKGIILKHNAFLFLAHLRSSAAFEKHNLCSQVIHQIVRGFWTKRAPGAGANNDACPMNKQWLNSQKVGRGRTWVCFQLHFQLVKQRKRICSGPCGRITFERSLETLENALPLLNASVEKEEGEFLRVDYCRFPI